MADFQTAYNLVLKAEGGYQNNAADTGNYCNGQLIGTKYGISAPALADYLGRCPSVNEMVNLPESTAKTIYSTKYWNKIRGNEIENQNTANMLFDMVVNMPGYFNQITKQAVNNQRLFITSFDLPFDNTELNLLNTVDQKLFFENVKTLREAAYRGIVENNPSKSVFLKGWLARLDRLEWNAKYGQPVKFAVIAGAILLIGLGTYLVLNRKNG